MDESLTWNTHLQQLTKKLTRAIGLLSKIRHYSPPSLMKTLNYSLFHSHLTYSSQIWGQGNGSAINKIMQLQSKAIRVISFLPKNSPTEAKKTELNILSLKVQITLQNILFIKSYLNKPSSNSFSIFFDTI